MPPERFDALPELFPALSTLRHLHARTHSDSLNSEASAGLPSGGGRHHDGAILTGTR